MRHHVKIAFNSHVNINMPCENRYETIDNSMQKAGQPLFMQAHSNRNYFPNSMEQNVFLRRASLQNVPR